MNETRELNGSMDTNCEFKCRNFWSRESSSHQYPSALLHNHYLYDLEHTQQQQMRKYLKDIVNS